MSDRDALKLPIRFIHVDTMTLVRLTFRVAASYFSVIGLAEDANEYLGCQNQAAQVVKTNDLNEKTRCLIRIGHD
jgi:hypothetical protein